MLDGNTAAERNRKEWEPSLKDIMAAELQALEEAYENEEAFQEAFLEAGGIKWVMGHVLFPAGLEMRMDEYIEGTDTYQNRVETLLHAWEDERRGVA